jgi:hypothetical protein
LALVQRRGRVVGRGSAPGVGGWPWFGSRGGWLAVVRPGVMLVLLAKRGDSTEGAHAGRSVDICRLYM